MVIDGDWLDKNEDPSPQPSPKGEAAALNAIEDNGGAAKGPVQPSMLPGWVGDKSVQDFSHEAEYRAFLLALEGVPWAEDFVDLLLRRGYTWRKSAYVAWASQPKHLRIPKTQGEFGALVGVSGHRITEYKSDKILGAEIIKFRKSVLLDSVPDVIDALVTSASDAGYKHHNDRKLLLEMAGEYQPRMNLGVGAMQMDEAEMEGVMDALPYDVLVALNTYFEQGGDAQMLRIAVEDLTATL